MDQTEKMEPIADVPGYKISENGRIVNQKTRRQLGGWISSNGYRRVTIRNKKYFIHRLVMDTYRPGSNPKLNQIDHINGNRLDNRLQNLRWVNQLQNSLAKDHHVISSEHGIFYPSVKVLGKRIVVGSYPSRGEALSAIRKFKATLIETIFEMIDAGVFSRENFKRHIKISLDL